MRRALLSTVIFFTIGFLVSGCFTVGSARFPEPTAGFQPKTSYDVTYDKLWSAVRHVLDTEGIGVTSSDKVGGNIVTDYIQGETILVVGLGVTITRYKYTITFEKIEKNKTRLGIVCKLESTAERQQWLDEGKNQKALISKLEKWLYQQIEKSL